MRSFGVARARYDFSARDRSELSLREGDTIKILSKKGHSGWWKGEVYGRVRARKKCKKNFFYLFAVFLSDLHCSCVSRWGSFQPTMWRRITLTTADVPMDVICRLVLDV